MDNNRKSNDDEMGVFILVTSLIIGIISAGGTWYDNGNPFYGFLTGLICTWGVLSLLVSTNK